MSGHFPTRTVTTEADVSQDVGTFSTVFVESKLNVSDETAGHSPVLLEDLLNETSCQVVLTRCQDIFQLCLWRQIRCLKSWCSLTLTEQFVVVKLNQRIITACSHQNSWNTLRTLCCSGWCWSEQVQCVLDPQRSGIKEAPRVLSAVSDISASRRHETSDFSCR